MRDIRDEYGGGGYAGRKQKRCGTTEMAKMGWKNDDGLGKY